MKILNKKSLRNFHILESLEAGIELSGSEVKSIRAGRIELGQSFARITNGQAYLINAHIPPLNSTPSKDYDPVRSRRLLLHKEEIQKLVIKISGSKMTLIPVSIYEKNNFLKVQLGLAKSKKEFDRRKIIKERDHQRRIEQELRGKE